MRYSRNIDGVKDARALALIFRRVGLALRRDRDNVATISPALCSDVGAASALAGSSSSRPAVCGGGTLRPSVQFGPAAAFLVPVVNASRTDKAGPTENGAGHTTAGGLRSPVAVTDRAHGRQLFFL